MIGYVPESLRSEFFMQVEQGLLHSFAKRLAYLKIFQSGAYTEGAAKLQKIIKYAKNLAKNEGKSCSTCIKPGFWLLPGTRKSDFGYPISVTSHDSCYILLLSRCLKTPRVLSQNLIGIYFYFLNTFKKEACQKTRVLKY